MFGNPETTTGGNALKFFASQRIEIRKWDKITEDKEQIWYYAKVKVAKNKIAAPFKTAELPVKWNMWYDKISDIIEASVLLKTKLSKGDKKLHVFFDLLYRASMDGDIEEIIKENVLNKEKTLTLFYTYEGSRFGVYIHKTLSTSFLKGKIYKEVPGTSFIISLNNLRFFVFRRKYLHNIFNSFF